MQDRRRPHLASLPIGLTALGLFLAAYPCLKLGFTTVRQQARLLSGYSRTQAQIISSRVVPSGRKTDEGSNIYEPEIVYKYVAGDHWRTGSRLNPLGLDVGAPRETVDAHLPGSAAAAYYNPLVPNDSFLDRGISFAPYGFLLLGLVGAFTGLLVLLAGVRKALRLGAAGRLLATGTAFAGLGSLLLTLHHYFKLSSGTGSAPLAWKVVLLLVLIAAGMLAAVILKPTPARLRQ